MLTFRHGCAMFCLFLTVSGCDRQRAILPAAASVTAPAPTPPPAENPRTFRVVSGADLAAVPAARVSVGGALHISDADGNFTVTASVGALPGLDLDVDAPGFLPRRTRVDGERVVVLWPVANQAEADALRVMVYQGRAGIGDVLIPPAPGEFIVTLRDAPLEVPGAWQSGADAFGATFGLSYRLAYSFQYETNESEVTFNMGGCAPISAWGFCRDSNLYYKIFRVLPQRALDPVTIRRVLASWFLGPNPLPGLMNAESPADDLSPFEIQTIRMILQRRLPNRWPDTDR